MGYELGTQLSPISAQKRHLSMDLIRGVAVLGILVMNIASFGNSFSYYMNPYVYGDPGTANTLTWHITHFFADQKFYTLFSMLFGAGIVLMAQRASSKGSAPAPIHYRRMGWLLVFGLLHGYFIWYGDILATYAVTGLWVYLFALRAKPKTKLITGIVLISLITLAMSSILLMLDKMPAEDLAEMTAMINPGQEILAKEITAYQGTWWQQFEHRIENYTMILLQSIFMFGPFRIGGGMLIGMALFQMGIFTGQKSKSFYIKFTIINLAIGYSLLSYDYFSLTNNNFSFKALWFSFSFLNSIASIFVALGYIGILCLWFNSNIFTKLRRKFEAVGQMAFTNYITQSLICTGLFYGLNLFSKLERFELYYVVAGVFFLQLTWSDWWLKRYHFGPLEWLWRSLSYSKAQPFSKRKP